MCKYHYMSLCTHHTEMIIRGSEEERNERGGKREQGREEERSREREEKARGRRAACKHCLLSPIDSINKEHLCLRTNSHKTISKNSKWCSCMKYSSLV